ncbi:MAG: ribonuclease Y [Verrucomicrobiota bacterium]|jgi:ribonuclease Y|nr:ribonuclease Y [Verrucomicrobiota bacterium]
MHIILASVELWVAWTIVTIVVLIGMVWIRKDQKRQIRRALHSTESSLKKHSRREAEVLTRSARMLTREETKRLRDDLENTIGAESEEIRQREKRLEERESLLDRQLQTVLENELRLKEERADFDSFKNDLKKRDSATKKLAEKYKAELSAVSKLSEDNAKEKFFELIRDEYQIEASQIGKRIVNKAKDKAEEDARRLIGIAIQRYAGEHTYESTTATVSLNGDEDIKGRIIGREGRNVRAFEAATGVTVLIDDTPNSVVLSGFDPVKREIARETMNRLVKDGRIHPTRIEEVAKKVTEENSYNMANLGEEAACKAGVISLNKEILGMLGKLRYRSSYSQNVLAHSVEVAHLMGLLAGEMGLDIAKAKRIGLLHDIGKAMSQDVEGPHAIVGGDFIKRNGEPEDVVNGVASHHGEVQYDYIWGILVSAADAISASRPGARSETMSTYLKRLSHLEKIGKSFEAVEKCYAVQAGREVRVLVNPSKVTDEESYDLARKIARKIEDELQYPGHIRVTMVRENRFVEYAK